MILFEVTMILPCVLENRFHERRVSYDTFNFQQNSVRLPAASGSSGSSRLPSTVAHGSNIVHSLSDDCVIVH